MSLIDEFYEECEAAQQAADEGLPYDRKFMVYSPPDPVKDPKSIKLFQAMAGTDDTPLYRHRQYAHMATHGMSSLPTHVNIRAVRGGAFVQVYYSYAYINMPFDSIRHARKYVKYLGLPIKRGDEQ